jgi:hypothetical protein
MVAVSRVNTTMTRESLNTEFQVMEFARHEEAAAFVAALSRFLNSPQGSRYAGREAVAEVWAESPEQGKAVHLFLSEGALVAAEAAFSPVRTERAVTREALPVASFLVIEGGKTPSWGAADAAARLDERNAIGGME